MIDSQPSIFRLLVWALFFLGVGLHILLCARGSIASRSNSIKTFRSWWEFNWQELGWRLLLDSAALMIWEGGPHVIGDVIGRQIPITYGTAPIVGLFVDRCLHTAGFTMGFTKLDMTKVAPPENQ